MWEDLYNWRIKKIFKEIFKDYAVERAILFGSYAKNTPTSKSDIDLVIDSKRFFGW